MIDRRRSTPAAVVPRASWPDAAHWTATLAELAAAPPLPAEQADAPGVVLVGAVVSVAAALAEARQSLEDPAAARAAGR